MRRMKRDRFTDEMGNEHVRELCLMDKAITDKNNCCKWYHYIVIDWTSDALGTGPETMVFLSDYKGDVVSYAELYVNNISTPEEAIKDAKEFMKIEWEG